MLSIIGHDSNIVRLSMVANFLNIHEFSRRGMRLDVSLELMKSINVQKIGDHGQGLISLSSVGEI